MGGALLILCSLRQWVTLPLSIWRTVDPPRWPACFEHSLFSGDITKSCCLVIQANKGGSARMLVQDYQLLSWQFILYLIRNGVFFLKKTKTTEILFCWKVSMIIFHFDNFQAITRVPDLFDIWSRLKTWLIANVLSSLSSSYSSLPSSSHHNMESFG